MMPAEGTRHTDNTRLEAFSDAIFGFAATLLVVSLDVPSTYDALVRSLYGFLAFGLSFAMLASIWNTHRSFFKRYPLGDPRTVVLNTVLLFLMLFYVYPLKFLTRLLALLVFRGHFGGDAVTISGAQLPGMFAIYGVGFTAVFGCFALMYFHAAKQAPSIGLGAAEVRTARDSGGQFVIMAGFGALSAGLALGNIGVRLGLPGWIYGLIGPALSIYWIWRHRGDAKPPTPS
ncbi:MAG: TMEM175 family protein [bacterium]